MTRRSGLLSVVCLAAILLAPLASGRQASAATDDPEWLAWINLYRSIGSLPAVAHDPRLDAAVTEHARYLVELDQEGLCAAFPHCEAIPPGTVTGDRAGRNILVRSSATLTEREVVEDLLTAPFHALSLLRPGLTQVGFGIYSNPDVAGFTSAGVIDVSSDATPTDLSQVVTWPASGASVPLTSYSGNETPDPLVATSCSALAFAQPGAPQEAGLPIIVMNVADSAVAADLVEVSSGTSLTTCVATSHDYPADSTQSLVLQSTLSFLVIPQDPLRVGESYRLTLSGAVDRVVEFGVVAPTLPPGFTAPEIPTTSPTDPTTDSTILDSTAPDSTSPGATKPVADDATGANDTGLPWLTILAFLLVGTAFALVIAAVIRSRSVSEVANDEWQNVLLALASAAALPATLFLDFGQFRLGLDDRTYRGIDIPLLAWGVPILAVVYSMAVVSDLRSERPIGNVARIVSSTVVVLAGLSLLAAEFSGALVPTGALPGALRQASVDWQSGLAPWAMLLVGLIAVGAAFAQRPWTELIASSSDRPLRWWLASLGMLGGIIGLTLCRYLPVASVSVFDEEITVHLRAIPGAGPLSLAGLLGLLVSTVLVRIGRITPGLLVGGAGLAMSSIPAALLSGAGEPLLRAVARFGALDVASETLSAPELDLRPRMTAVPTVLFVATMLCAVSLAALVWDDHE